MLDHQTAELIACIARQLPDLDTAVMQYWIGAPTKLQALLLGLTKTSCERVSVASILSLVGTTKVPTTTIKFVARDKFVVNTQADALVKISDIGSNFTSYFLSGEGEIEDPIMEQSIRCHKLLQASPDGPIIKELGGKAEAETTLFELFSLLEMQGNGEDGVLLTNGLSDIFYIRDQTGLLRVVDVYWLVIGWHVCASSVEDSCEWGDGFYVFSRNVLSPSEPVVS
ncbi:MAG: hypothetical protein AAB534_02055 [Patescibacteria group bacterium]